MSQYPNSNLSNSMVLASSVPCTITSVVIDNSMNSHDTWVHFKDSTDVTSAATGATGTYRIMIPANSIYTRDMPSGNTEDPDGIWAFVTGITLKATRDRAYSGNTVPSSALEIFMQLKP